MDKSFWGPSLWRSIHSTAVTYTPTSENATAFKGFIMSLTYIMPCEYCRRHLVQNLTDMNAQGKSLDNYLGSNKRLFHWTYILHDQVNQHLGKTSPPYETVFKKYFNPSVCPDCSIQPEDYREVKYM